MISLLLDQGLPRSLVTELSAYNIDSLHVGTIEMSMATDEEIIEKAIELQAVVVTFDSDFHTILARRNGSFPSVIRIRIEGLKAPAMAILLHKALVLAKQEIVSGSVITITGNGIRVRRLPFG